MARRLNSQGSVTPRASNSKSSLANCTRSLACSAWCRATADDMPSGIKNYLAKLFTNLFSASGDGEPH